MHEIPNLHDDDNDDALMAAISGKIILEIADYEYGDSVDLSRINGEFLTNKLLKTGGSKKNIKSFLVMSGNFFASLKNT